VAYVGAPPQRKFMLARFSQVRSDHVLADAWEARAPAEGKTYVPFPSGKYMPCYGEAKPLGPFVAGILYFGEVPPQGQMSYGIRLKASIVGEQRPPKAITVFTPPPTTAHCAEGNTRVRYHSISDPVDAAEDPAS
jgi:hypothetical protein